MYLKLMNGPDGHVIFPVEGELRARTLKRDDLVGVREDALHIGQPIEDNPGWQCEFWVGGKQILTTEPAYLMSASGQTIEKYTMY